jgi:hypothetical protein
LVPRAYLQGFRFARSSYQSFGVAALPRADALPSDFLDACLGWRLRAPVADAVGASGAIL